MISGLGKYYPRNATSFMPQQDSPSGLPLPQMLPQLPAQTPPAPAPAPMPPAPAPQTNNGGLFGMGGLSPSQKTAMVFAGLRDAFTSLTRNPTDDVGKQRDLLMQSNMLGMRQQALNDLSNAKTPAERQNAIIRLVMSGGNGEGLAAAAKITQPTVTDLRGGYGTVYDPNSGTFGTIGNPPQPPPAKPLINGGMISYDNGLTWGQIPGYVENAQSVANARRAPKQPAPGAINIPHPSTAY